MAGIVGFNSDLPLSTQYGGGFQTEWGTVLPVGGRVAAYVRSTGVQDLDPTHIKNNLVTTINSALARCRSGYGDTVLVMPGHTESVSTADFLSNMLAGTRILGLGYGTMRPTLTWTAAGSTVLFNVANVHLDNFILKLADAANAGVSVAAPITVSAAGCRITRCQMRIDGDANDLATIPVTTTAAADDLVIANNVCIAATAAPCTTFFDFIGADRLIFCDNQVAAATASAGVGIVRFATPASLNITMLRNRLVNRMATSTAVVTCMAGVTGFVDDNLFYALGDHSDAEVIGDANGVWATAAGSLEFGAGNRAGNLVATVPIALSPLTA